MPEDINLGQTIVTAVTTVVNDTVTMFADLLPVALVIFGFTFAVRKGMRFFKTAAN